MNLLLTVVLLPLLSNDSPFERAGVLENDRLVEASGLAASTRSDDLLWSLNDGGHGPWLFALDASGRHRGAVRVAGVKNRDWEDLAAFVWRDRSWLLIAEIGDNSAKHALSYLHLVPEPEPGDTEVAPEWTLAFRYPDGPRDAEALAVDPLREEILILSKRTLPPELYRLPLVPAEEPVEATALGLLDSLPPPSRSEVARAPVVRDWFWQPTAFDIRGDVAIVMTYRYVYRYDRSGDSDWLAALNGVPESYRLPNVVGAESAALAGEDIFVTSERKNARLYRYRYTRIPVE